MKELICLIASIFCVWLNVGKVQAADVQPTSLEQRRQVAFVVIDNSGNVNESIFKDWRQQVRQGYKWPYYEIVDDLTPAAVAEEEIRAEGKSTSKLDLAVFKNIAEKAQVDVVALMIIRDMDVEMIHPLGFFRDDGPDRLCRVYANADMYVYKKDGDKMLKKILRHVKTTEEAIAEPPERVIKYAMRKLVNTMENRPQI